MKELYEKAKIGDKLAEQELFRQLIVRFRHFAARKVNDEEAREIAQVACVTVLEKYKTETFTVNFQAWAYGVLKMTILKHYRNGGRHNKTEMPLVDGMKILADDDPNPMLRQYLLDCIRLLAKTFRKYARILNLRYQGYSTAEICNRLEINPEQYYVYVGRGRSMLKNCLVQKGGLP